MVLFELTLILIGFILIGLSSKKAVEILVKISRHFGLSEFTIGFLVVGIVTVFPELSIGINSALAGSSNFGLGIVFGSNIADLTLIIGIVALTAGAFKFSASTLKQTKLLVLAAILPVILLFDGEISRFEGIILLIAFVIYIFRVLKLKQHNSSIYVEHHKDNLNIIEETLVFAFALALLLISGHIITDAAQALSQEFFVPIFFIGTIIAVGTCLPELNLSFQAIRRKHSELGFGDIIGNVFADCMLTIGVIALIQPIKPDYPQLAIGSGIFMLISLLILLYLSTSKNKITKTHGIVLIVIYFIFIAAQFALETQIVGSIIG